MKVVEIFDSIDGEGIRTGKTATFIRLAGCNLRCSYCDTLYALFGEDEPCEYTEMTIEKIVSKVNKAYNRVTLTGGEPLVHKDCAELVNALIENDIEVNIETNGAADIVEFLSHIKREGRLFFTIDYKLPSSGMGDRMLWRNFINLRPYDVIKFVVGSKQDISVMKEVVGKLSGVYKKMPHIYAGAVFGQYEPRDLVEAIMKEPLFKDVVFQLQIHKIIWNPDERGV